MSCNKRVPVSLHEGQRQFNSVDMHLYMKALNTCVNEQVPADTAERNHKTTDRLRGVGDTIAKMTNKVGIKPCGGCKKRQAMLNKAFPYKQKGETNADTSKPDATDDSSEANSV